MSGLYRLAAFEERNQPSAKGPSLQKAPKVRHRFSASLAKNLSVSASMDTWQTWCMRRTDNPENGVRVHECPHVNTI